jgi:hypothetical protein
MHMCEMCELGEDIKVESGLDNVKAYVFAQRGRSDVNCSRPRVKEKDFLGFPLRAARQKSAIGRCPRGEFRGAVGRWSFRSCGVWGFILAIRLSSVSYIRCPKNRPIS